MAAASGTRSVPTEPSGTRSVQPSQLADVHGRQVKNRVRGRMMELNAAAVDNLIVIHV